MKREDLIKKLSDAVVLEEVFLMSEANRALALVEDSDLEKKDEIREKIGFLVQGNAKHARMVVKLIKKVVASNETEF